MSEVKLGFDGMPPIKDNYKLEEKRLIATKAEKFGTKVITEVYVLKRQTIVSQKRLIREKLRPLKNTKVIIQSVAGQEIILIELLKKAGSVDKIYVRTDQNKAYWVIGNETGSVDLW